jgi:hypothetical protein
MKNSGYGDQIILGQQEHNTGRLPEIEDQQKPDRRRMSEMKCQHKINTGRLHQVKGQYEPNFRKLPNVDRNPKEIN